MNYDIKIDLLKLKGARIMDIQGAREVRHCIVIPIDNEIGTIIDGYFAKDRATGMKTERSLNSCFLNLTAFELASGSNSYGQSHYIKPKLTREKMELLNQEQVKQIPFVGHLKPWTVNTAAQPGAAQSSGDEEW